MPIPKQPDSSSPGVKRLTLLLLAGITAFDLHAAVLQGWEFRDVNANGPRAATLADAAQDTYERGIGICAPNRLAVPILKIVGGPARGNPGLDTNPVSLHPWAAGFEWTNDSVDSAVEAVALTARSFTLLSNKFQGGLS